MAEQVYSIAEIPPILTVPELAKFLGIGRAGAYALVQSGQIEAKKIGKQLRIPRHSLLRYLGVLS